VLLALDAKVAGSLPNAAARKREIALAARGPVPAANHRHRPYPPGGERFFGNHRLTAPLVRQRTE
jgi:hypothetical protein